MVDQFGVIQQGYNIYDEYIERYYLNAIKYARFNGLPIRYYKIEVQDSFNFDIETSIQTSYKNFQYSIYDFVPVIEANPPVQQNYFDPTIQGTSYNVTITLTIAGIKNPLPGDLFRYYDLNEKENLDKAEIFRVKHVDYIRAINKKVFIYRIEAEYAPLKYESLLDIEENRIINHYIWNNDLDEFITEEQFDYFNFIKNNYNTINNKLSELYDQTDNSYQLCKLNSIIKIIQYKYPNINFRVVKDERVINFELGNFLAFFDLYQKKLLNQDPVLQDEDFSYYEQVLQSNEPDNYNIYNDYLNDLLNELNEKKEVIFQDQSCLDQETYDVLKISLDENGNINFEAISDPDIFNYYYEVYKLLASYRQLDKEFYKDTEIKILYNNKIIDDSLYWDIIGAYDGSRLNESYLTCRCYDPGYYLSYQDGPVYFDP